MENKSHALIAGLFTILLGIALALAAMWLGRDTAEKRFYQLTTHASVSGLSPQAPVRYRGLDVGKVETISFDPAVAGQILVGIAVNPTTPVTPSTYAQLGYQGVTGIAYIELDDDGKSTALVKPGAVTRIALRPGLLDKLSDGAENMVSQLQVTVARLNDLLGPANQKALTDTLVGINQATQRVNELSAQLSPSLQRLPATIDATRATMGSVTAVADDYASLSKRLQDPDGLLSHVDTTLGEFDGAARLLTQGTLPRVQTLSSDASRTARSLSHTLDHLDERPQSLIFGAQPNQPGPGEPGFVAPSAH